MSRDTRNLLIWMGVALLVGTLIGGGGLNWLLAPFSFLVKLLFWVLLALLVAAVIGWLARSGLVFGTKREDSPLDILKRRYASGEIGKEEFEEKKRDLV